MYYPRLSYASPFSSQDPVALTQVIHISRTLIVYDFIAAHAIQDDKGLIGDIYVLHNVWPIKHSRSRSEKTGLFYETMCYLKKKLFVIDLESCWKHNYYDAVCPLDLAP